MPGWLIFVIVGVVLLCIALCVVVLLATRMRRRQSEGILNIFGLIVVYYIFGCDTETFDMDSEPPIRPVCMLTHSYLDVCIKFFCVL